MMPAISVTQPATKKIIIVFCMKYQPRAIVRLAHITFRGHDLSFYSAHWRLQRHTFSSQVSDYSEDPAMGKEKVQFQLKTPKGTKDCKHSISLANNTY